MSVHHTDLVYAVIKDIRKCRQLGHVPVGIDANQHTYNELMDELNGHDSVYNEEIIALLPDFMPNQFEKDGFIQVVIRSCDKGDGILDKAWIDPDIDYRTGQKEA